eukprot:m51a1_g8087 hypothetical protein (491) ;mRNA; f:39240-41984
MSALTAAKVDPKTLAEDPVHEQELRALASMFPHVAPARVAEVLRAAHGDADAAVSELLGEPSRPRPASSVTSHVASAAAGGARRSPPPKLPLDDSTFERRVLEEVERQRRPPQGSPAVAAAPAHSKTEQAQPDVAVAMVAEKTREKVIKIAESRLEHLRSSCATEEIAQLQQQIEELTAQRDRAEAERIAAEAEAEEARRRGCVSVALRESPDNSRALVVSWSIRGLAPSSKDWVGLFIHDREWKYSQWAYTNGAAEGSHRFDGLVPGYYDARVFLGSMPSPLGRSDSALVGARVDVAAAHCGRRIDVSWAPEAGRGDWVALYAVGTRSNKKYLAYVSLGAGDTSAALEAPRAPGAYEVRYFYAQSGYVYSGKTRPVVVPNGDTLAIDPASAPPRMVLRWACTTRAPNPRYDWIGLYESGADSRRYLASHYTSEGTVDTATESGSITFDLSKIGKVKDNTEYEFRFFAGEAKYTPLMAAKLVISQSPLPM